MKYSIAVKFIAFLLCACSLVCAVGCAVGIFYLGEYQLYTESIEDVKQQELEYIGYNLAWYYSRQYAVENYSDCPEAVKSEFLSGYGFPNLIAEYDYSVTICQDDQILQEYYSGAVSDAASKLTENNITVQEIIAPSYPMLNQDGVAPAAENYLYTENQWYDSGNDLEGFVHYTVDYYRAPELAVTVSLPQDAVYASSTYPLTEVLYNYRFNLIYILMGSLLLFAVTLVYLCCAAGRSKGTTDIRPMGPNRLPLDIYALIAGIGCFLLMLLGSELFRWAFSDNILNLAGVTLAGLCALGVSILCVAFIFAFAAQAKIKNRYWLKHTFIGWSLIMLFRGIRWCVRCLSSVMRLLPLIWQWLLTAFLMVLSIAFSLMMIAVSYGVFAMFWLLVLLASIVGCIGIVCYGGWAFGTLIKGAKIMAQGNLYYQINTRFLFGCFRDFAVELNSLAGAAQIAAANQLKSERMKTELITNVSHDIKTPLTSIINYVDLLQKPHTEQEQEAYLEVLSRQSLRLKKLIDDLMDMSKASTGNMNVEISRLDAVETVNQALGEFSDKLDRAGLIPVFRHPDTPITMLADGRLTWRVLSNLLSNAVKYAMPGTRLYLDLMQLESSVVISLKNISREELNVGADELMERFVRGDQSRNTEGSGLGLNIAKSLMDLQKGQLQLLVDGDLFKVTLIFPAG